MREFYLKNKDGATYNFNKLGLVDNLESLFFEVSGLGFTVASEFSRIGSNYIQTQKYYEQEQISGTIFFAEPGAYQKYFNFNRFVERSPLKLIYKPDSNLGEFERDVEVTSLQKTEIGVNGLYCEIGITPTSLIKKIVFATSKEIRKEVSILKTPYELNAVPVQNGGNYTDENGQEWIADYVDYKKGVLVRKCKKINLNTGDLNGSSNYPSYYLDKDILDLRKFYGEGDLKNVPVLNSFGGFWNVNTDPRKPDNNILWVTPYSYGSSTIGGVDLKRAELDHTLIVCATGNRIFEEIPLTPEDTANFQDFKTFEKTTYISNSENATVTVTATTKNGTVTENGETITLNDTESGTFQNVLIYGKSKQDSEPTIDKFVEIKSISNSETWSSSEEIDFNGGIDTDFYGNKKYNYRYNYQYSDGSNNSITFNIDSNLQSPLTLTIKGPCKNPEWRHYLNGKLVATGKVNVTVLPGAELIIDSNLPFSISELDSSGEFSVDVYQKSDFSTERFLFLEHGQNVISVSDSDANILNVTGKGYVTYASV